MAEREPQPLSELIDRQQQLSTRLEKKQAISSTSAVHKRLEGLDPWTQTNRMLRLGKALSRPVNFLQRSIQEVADKLTQISAEVDSRKGDLISKAQTYQKELAERQAQFKQMQALNSTIPAIARVVEQFNARFEEFKALQETNPEIKIGLSFLQPTPPAAQPPVEERVQPEKENLPEISLDERNSTLKVDGTEIHLGNTELIVIKPLFEAQGKPVLTSLLRDILDRAGYAPQPGSYKFSINKKAGRDLIIQTGSSGEGFKYILPIKLPEEEQKPTEPTSPEQPAAPKPVQPETSEDKTQDYRERRLVFKKTLPDGQEIEIRGKKKAEAFDLIMTATQENPLPSGTITDTVLIDLRKILESFGWGITNPNEKGGKKKAVYYPEKVQEEKAEAGLTMDRTQLEADVEELKTRIQSIQAKIQSGALSAMASGLLEAFTQDLKAKEAVLNTLPKTLIVNPEDVPVIPYEIPKEQLRTRDETATLSLIIQELTQYSRLWFDRIQESLQHEGRYQNLAYGNRRYNPYEKEELKRLIEAAFNKMARESQIPLLRQRWDDKDEAVWEKLQQVKQRLTQGNDTQFLRTINTLIDTAAKEYYEMHPDKKEGESWII